MAADKTEDWVRRRTGHRSSTMIALYREQAETFKELGLGQLKPLHEVIPELAKMAPGSGTLRLRVVGGRDVDDEE